MLPGLAKRLTKEIAIFAPQRMKIEVVPPEGRFSAWVGGSILSSLSTFKDMCITKNEYSESGSAIVHKRCP